MDGQDSYQQSLNELFATKLHEQQGFDNYTVYEPVLLSVENGNEGLGCMCYDYCSEDIESISAWELLQTVKLRQNESYYYPFKQVCLSLGISNDEFDRFIDYQIMTDFLLSNTDRHMNNIAILRNPDTLEVLGFAPIFDSGNSMFYDIPFELLSGVKIKEIKTHSFIEGECRLLQYVHDRNLVDINKALADFSIYEKDIVERHIRIEKLKELYEKKLALFCDFQRGRDIWKYER